MISSRRRVFLLSIVHMASSLEELRGVLLRPLSARVRDLVEPEYTALHESTYQYEDSKVKIDSTPRVAPSKFAETSSVFSSVALVKGTNKPRASPM
jgi:hypothetical protein